jgi:hypothetical protein
MLKHVSLLPSSPQTKEALNVISEKNWKFSHGHHTYKHKDWHQRNAELQPFIVAKFIVLTISEWHYMPNWMCIVPMLIKYGKNGWLSIKIQG